MGVFDKMLENLKDEEFIKEIIKSLDDVEKIQNNELPKKTAREFLNEMKNESL